MAEQNLARQQRIKALIEIRNQNALDVDYDDATVLVLIDPFGSETLRSMFVRVREFIERRPQPVRLAFYRHNTIAPENVDVLASSGWLARGQTLDMDKFGKETQNCQVSLWTSMLDTGEQAH